MTIPVLSVITPTHFCSYPLGGCFFIGWPQRQQWRDYFTDHALESRARGQ